MTTATMNDAKPGLKNMAARMDAAYAWLVETLSELGAIDATSARKVADYYIKAKIAKRDVVNGCYSFTHGAFLDRDVIARAVAATEGGAA